MKYLAFIMSISLLVLLTFSQCGDDVLELTKDKIEGAWIETAPCNLSTGCDTLVFTSSDQFNSGYRNPLSTYSIIAQDTLLITTPGGFQKLFIEFSNNNQELVIHDFLLFFIGDNEDVYYEKQQ